MINMIKAENWRRNETCVCVCVCVYVLANWLFIVNETSSSRQWKRRKVYSTVEPSENTKSCLPAWTAHKNEPSQTGIDDNPKNQNRQFVIEFDEVLATGSEEGVSVRSSETWFELMRHTWPPTPSISGTNELLEKTVWSPASVINFDLDWNSNWPKLFCLKEEERGSNL